MSEKSQGLEKYIPTRLEWLALMLNCLFPVRGQGRGLDMFFTAADDGKTLNIHIRYDSNLHEGKIDQLVDSIKTVVNSVSKDYEWDSWLEVDTIIQKEESNK